MNSPISILHDVEGQSVKDQNINFKPCGLWYSVGTSWLDWCEVENFGFGSHLYEVSMDRSGMLIIDTDEKFVAFNDEYKVGGKYCQVDWLRVSESYTGIEISPYNWDRRSRWDSYWYYSWDVASGCIWDVSGVAIKEVFHFEGDRVEA